MLEYKAVEDGTTATTVSEIWKCLQKYGLTEAFKAGKIAISCDGGMEPMVQTMFANSSVKPEINICVVHSCKYFCLPIIRHLYKTNTSIVYF